MLSFVSDFMTVHPNATMVQIRTLVLIHSYKPQSTLDSKRLDKATDMFFADVVNADTGMNTDSGLYGKVAELLAHDSKSTITRVQAQGRNDNYIIVNGKRKPCEVKTNGGRIGNLYAMSERSQESRYIAYKLDFIVKAGKPRKDGSRKPAEHRKAYKVMTVKAFLQLLEETGATKVIGHSDSDREIAVQSDSKKLYKALMTGGYADYKRGAEYEEWTLW